MATPAQWIIEQAKRAVARFSFFADHDGVRRHTLAENGRPG
jgi:hypothetical protein